MAARRRLNRRLIKLHRSYTVDELARTLRAHKNTVRLWLKSGLACVDRRRPTLIHGRAALEYLEARDKGRKQALRPGEIFCVACRKPQRPAGLIADYVPSTDSSGNLRGICPDCDRLIHRAVSVRKLDDARGGLEVQVMERPQHIEESTYHSVNCDFTQEPESDENA